MLTSSLSLLLLSVASATLGMTLSSGGSKSNSTCRSQPGDSSFPTTSQLSLFNSSIDGRLVNVVPSGKFCQSFSGGCSNTEWTDSVFRDNIPGAMTQVNWEQDYLSTPPSLCVRNGTTCGQGNVPVFGINATTSEHIQAGIRFAQAHNLKIAVKASGHDFLGRSTAKNSLLLWTRYFQNITFQDSFQVGNKDLGSAVTVGSGVGLNTLYRASKAQGKTFVGGSAATVVPAGGYVQGAGHSSLSPMLGLAADNVLEFDIVLANGSRVTANDVSNTDLFWALRGGGAGSWGVIISATFRTFPIFNAVHQQTIIVVNSSADVGKLASAHARHIFDWDDLHVGQYFYLRATPPTFTWTIDTVFPNTSDVSTANRSLVPFLTEVTGLGFDFQTNLASALINDVLFQATDVGQDGQFMGSRLFSDDVYHNNVSAIGDAYQQLLDTGADGVLGHLIAGGQVSKNADIDSAIHPKWRTAKTHMIVFKYFPASTSPADVEAIQQDITNNKVPVLDQLAGPGSASYSNEADLHEPTFQTTFFGPNYDRLSSIKNKYDPQALFIVGAGVGSEKWDADGLCKV